MKEYIKRMFDKHYDKLVMEKIQQLCQEFSAKLKALNSNANGEIDKTQKKMIMQKYSTE